jgi:hypothetical protein
MPVGDDEMTGHLVVVKAAFDSEAGVWFIEHSSFPGLTGEASSFEELAKRVPDMLIDLMEAAGSTEDKSDIPVEIIGSLGTIVRLNEVKLA